MQRAYEMAGVDPRTIQFVEAHGVSNPDFDRTELEALATLFGGIESTLSPRPVESVKSLIGHTVWAAGAASVLKICRALEEHVVPPQPMDSGRAPTPDPQLEGSGFQIPRSARSWPPNADGEPRRAGVSAFGFGGTNAHAVVEAFSPSYHARVAARVRTDSSRAAMAVVGIAAIRPEDDEKILIDLPAAAPPDRTARLSRSALRAALPADLRPDVADQLDLSQLASVAGAERALGRLANWRDHRDRIGVVVGMIGRTARALSASERVYRDELQRLIAATHADLGLERDDAERVGRKLHHLIGAGTAPLTPHTFMGMLPNIAAARVAGLLDLHGPNLVIDAGGRSALEVLGAAASWLARGMADVTLACLLRLHAHQRPQDHDAALVLALTPPELAHERGWEILGELVVGAHDEDKVKVQPASAPSIGSRPSQQLTVSRSRVMAGLDELARALDMAARGETATVRWSGVDDRPVATSHETALFGPLINGPIEQPRV
jgi:acyl transferase domain-containing protein